MLPVERLSAAFSEADEACRRRLARVLTELARVAPQEEGTGPSLQWLGPTTATGEGAVEGAAVGMVAGAAEGAADGRAPVAMGPDAVASKPARPGAAQGRPGSRLPGSKLRIETPAQVRVRVRVRVR